jgi:hypothetical protein
MRLSEDKRDFSRAKNQRNPHESTYESLRVPATHNLKFFLYLPIAKYMELRAEPRFGTRSSAVVEAIRDKIYTYDITITEVSGTGLRIEMAEELKVGENVRLLVDGYHMFAQVRRCVPSASGFIVGVERIDAWNGPPPANALDPLKTATAPPAKVLARTKLKNPLDNLRVAALRALFADPRMRTREIKYQGAFIAVGCMALAGWAGFGAGSFLHGKSQGVAPAGTAAIKPLPSTPKSAAVVAPPKPNAPNLVASEISTRPVIAPAAAKARVEEPPVQKAVAVTPPKVAALPAVVQASRISIKASDISWVTACVDGAKVLDTLLVKGYVGQIPFSRQAKIRFGNAGAVELGVGNQPPEKVGRLGEVRTVKVTPTGYTLMTGPSAFNCSIE